MRVDLDSQAGAALGAARVDHGAAGLGFHAGAETVGALAANGRRLVSAFHVESFLRLQAGSAGQCRSAQKNLLKNRVLDIPGVAAVKRVQPGGLRAGYLSPVDNLAEGE
jgi:hypothetical protein